MKSKVFWVMLILIALTVVFNADFALANQGTTDKPEEVAKQAAGMAKSLITVAFVSIPIVYMLGVVVAAVVFAFKAFAKAKNDQVDNPGKVAAMTGFLTALVGFGGGGVLFLAADRWIFGGAFFSSIKNMLNQLNLN